ncbi:unnamed protein product [Protopolystoma xenopodis]|uniref:Uncharacterized protein n=1 Tax=Protopolystoma xenopodis TaxID=117903 RepID=A0A448WGL7_9PLAT|nr:unnamed protein product [Protopolystoma xenopodis]
MGITTSPNSRLFYPVSVLALHFPSLSNEAYWMPRLLRRLGYLLTNSAMMKKALGMIIKGIDLGQARKMVYILAASDC